MGEYRLGKDVTAHYSSIEEMVNDFGKEMPIKRTKDENKLNKQREKFVGKCRVCGELLTWIKGTNICACQNPKCRGKAFSFDQEDGTKRIIYKPVYRVLNDSGLEIAENLFAE